MSLADFAHSVSLCVGAYLEALPGRPYNVNYDKAVFYNMHPKVIEAAKDALGNGATNKEYVDWLLGHGYEVFERPNCPRSPIIVPAGTKPDPQWLKDL